MSFAEVSKKKYFIPKKGNNEIKVMKPPLKEGGTLKKELMHAQSIERMTRDNAWRELVSNVIDGIVDTNNDSYDGLSFIEGVNSEKENVILFYNKDYIFGEIIYTQEKIIFNNYGPLIDNIQQVVSFGKSNKGKVKRNQIGQHGEGLKRAALKLLVDGFIVKASFPVPFPLNRKLAHLVKLNFSIDEEENLLLSCRPVNPPQDNNNIPLHKFTVVVESTDDTPLDFDIKRFLLWKPEYFKGCRDDYDYGSVILDPALAGNIYVWHVKIMNLNEEHLFLKYAYDIFLEKIGRDRDNIHEDVILESIGNIWSYAIVNYPDMARTFFNEVVINRKINSFCYEVLALKYLTAEAIIIMYNLLLATIEFPRKYLQSMNLNLLIRNFPLPINEKKAAKIARRHVCAKEHFLVVSDHATDMFKGVFGSTKTHLEKLEDDFSKLDARLLLPGDSLKAIRDFFVVKVAYTNLPLKFTWNPATKILTINGNVYLDRGNPDYSLAPNLIHKFLNNFLFHIFPEIDPESKLDGVKIIQKIHDQYLVPPKLMIEEVKGKRQGEEVAVAEESSSKRIKNFVPYNGPQLYTIQQ